ncbi:MAG: flagellar biosynthetic protein FliO [Planctomycetes bacterium]|nr:flagellar biosynthetic protein FliO [Planctomycetota bacterium]
MIQLTMISTLLAAQRKPGPFSPVVSVVLVVAALVSCQVMASDGDEPEIPAALVSPNQSVAISDSAPPPMVTNAEPQSAESLRSDDPEPEAKEAAAPAWPSTIRRSRGTATNPVAGDDSRPWYRTGMGALAIVLALVAGVYWLARRWVPAMRGGDSKLMRVIGRTSLTPKHQAVLVHLGRRVVMVGITSDGARTLCEIHDPDEVADFLVRANSRSAGDLARFDSQLLGEMSEYARDADDEPEVTARFRQQNGPGGPALKNLLTRLRALRTN